MGTGLENGSIVEFAVSQGVRVSQCPGRRASPGCRMESLFFTQGNNG